MNPWFDRFTAALGRDPAPLLDREEALLLLELAGAAARGAGARQFAPLATYLAGRAAADGAYADRLQLIRAAIDAAGAAGPAEEPLGIE
jgi:hypothetical protein